MTVCVCEPELARTEPGTGKQSELGGIQCSTGEAGRPKCLLFLHIGISVAVSLDINRMGGI